MGSNGATYIGYREARGRRSIFNKYQPRVTVVEGGTGAKVGNGGHSIMSTLNHLPGSVLLLIISYLPGRKCAQLACVDSSFRLLVEDDKLWEGLCQKDWPGEGGATPTTAEGEPCATYKAMYTSLHASFAKYGDFYFRAKKLFTSFRDWSATHLPELGGTLARGATEAELDALETALHVTLPPAVRAVYRVCNGQNIQLEDEGGSVKEGDPACFHGLLGAYEFYDHMVSMRLLPLSSIRFWSPKVFDHLPHFLRDPEDLSTKILIGASFNMQKLVFLDWRTGLVYTPSRQETGRGEMIVCVPDEGRAIPPQRSGDPKPSRASRDDPFVPRNSRPASDGFLRWLEEHAWRLHSGRYALRNLGGSNNSRGICLFPEQPPLCTQAITQGVQVRCSAVFVPEASAISALDDSRHFFSYSVRMRLLLRNDGRRPGSSSGSESEGGARPHSSVQLVGRHWIIRDGNKVVSEVRGEAVVGQYPLLQEGAAEEFVYQSCTGQRSAAGSVEGDFRFVPGSISHPTGDEFDVVVARFPLIVPTFIY
eukprot:TRINITY_DN19259_c0_g1_i1.p1 TRINITY_DN19259_c0_g1~~TRINITY_DN19259_c0_g1_i1.p1  ORF type:complete len:536 (-),score=83.81 TRINITY_DN19259_c0_g1_i1:1304-2911(-)